jgi:hypothetical protein
MHDPLPQTGRWLRSVVKCHFNYYVVPGNLASLGAFRDRVLAQWWRTLCRRSQRHGTSRTRILALAQHLLPQPNTFHLFLDARFAAISAIRTGCAKERSSGSEEGVVSNHDPYSDRQRRWYAIAYEQSERLGLAIRKGSRDLPDCLRHVRPPVQLRRWWTLLYRTGGLHTKNRRATRSMQYQCCVCSSRESNRLMARQRGN